MDEIYIEITHNGKTFSYNPGRSCLKIIGEPSFILTIMAVIRRTGDKIIKARPEHTISKQRFTNFS